MKRGYLGSYVDYHSSKAKWKVTSLRNLSKAPLTYHHPRVKIKHSDCTPLSTVIFILYLINL